MLREATPLMILALAWTLVAAPSAALARVVEIFPSNADASCNEEFENVANTLQPGDELVLHGGIYTQTCRRALTVNGTAAQPITIRAAPGERPILTRPAVPHLDYPQNNVDIENSSYLVIRGLAFRGGSSGLTVSGHHITLEDNEISETSNNAIAMNRGNTDAFVIRHNHIHHTGLLDLVAGTTEGEGLYIGCNNNACTASNHLIEGNYIHDLRATSAGGNDGIEVKVGSYNNIVRDNVIHDTITGTQFPCIFVYGGGPAVNTVEGNVMWNCGEAIQVVADVVVRNNIILTSRLSGITAEPHAQVAEMRNVTIVNNTIYGHPKCLSVRWPGAATLILANNALYCPGTIAVDAAGLTGPGITVRANYVEGAVQGVSLDGTRFVAGGTAAAAFTNPVARNLWPLPSSVLRDAADPAFAPARDFNGTARTSPYDVGAYQTYGITTNPGWSVTPGFKNVAVPASGGIAPSAP